MHNYESKHNRRDALKLRSFASNDSSSDSSKPKTCASKLKNVVSQPKTYASKLRSVASQLNTFSSKLKNSASQPRSFALKKNKKQWLRLK